MVSVGKGTWGVPTDVEDVELGTDDVTEGAEAWVRSEEAPSMASVSSASVLSTVRSTTVAITGPFSSSCDKLAALAAGDLDSALECPVSEMSMTSDKRSFISGVYGDGWCRIVDVRSEGRSSSDNCPSMPSELRSLTIILTRAWETGASAPEVRDELSSLRGFAMRFRMAKNVGFGLRLNRGRRRAEDAGDTPSSIPTSSSDESENSQTLPLRVRTPALLVDGDDMEVRLLRDACVTAFDSLMEEDLGGYGLDLVDTPERILVPRRVTMCVVSSSLPSSDITARFRFGVTVIGGPVTGIFSVVGARARPLRMTPAAAATLISSRFNSGFSFKRLRARARAARASCFPFGAPTSPFFRFNVAAAAVMLAIWVTTALMMTLRFLLSGSASLSLTFAMVAEMLFRA